MNLHEEISRVKQIMGVISENTYKIKSGDTLGKISKQFGVSVDELAKYNNIKNINYVKIGQVINIPNKGSQTNVNNNNNKIKVNNYQIGSDSIKDTAGTAQLKKQSEYRNAKFKEFIKQIGEISSRTYQQLYVMMEKGTLKGDSFIVVNKDAALASLFNPNYTFITNSSITTGRNKDTDVEEKQGTLTYPDWMKLTIDNAKKGKDQKVLDYIKNVKKFPGLVDSNGYINYKVYQTLRNKGSIQDFPFSYSVNRDITTPGAYNISQGYNVKGFAGDKMTNSYPLVIPGQSDILPMAIHGYAGKERGDKISRFNKIPVNQSKPESRAGEGCINVDENFLQKMGEIKPKWVIILPDSGKLVDLKIVSSQTWSQKILSLGEKCVQSIISLFS